MKRAELDTSFAAAAGRARSLIGLRLADARAHALAGSQADAIARLDELSEALSAHLSDRRTAFVRAAVGQPHAGLEHVARTTAILGRDQQADVRNYVKTAKMLLRSELMAGGDPERLRHWEQAHASAIGHGVTLALSNAQIALEAAAVVLLNEEPNVPAA
jgi:hypothetical protein